MRHVEFGGASAVFHIPDWFGEGRDWTKCEAPYWTHYSGNYAWDTLWECCAALGISISETCDDPQGKWLEVEFDPLIRDLSQDINWVQEVLDRLIEEEKRYVASQKNEDCGDGGSSNADRTGEDSPNPCRNSDDDREDCY